MALRRFGQRGDSFVSILIAGGLLSGTAVVGGGVVKLMRKSATYSTVISSAVAVESAIMQALQNPNTYAAADTAAMRGGGNNLLSSVRINGQRGLLGTDVEIARFNTPTRLTRDGLPCVAAEGNPNSANFCAITTNVAMNCTGTPPSTVCRAAYQVTIDARANEGTAVPPFGAASWPPNYPSDFTSVISYDLYRRPGAKTTCDSGELFVTGMDKANGNVTCARPTDATLPTEGIPDQVYYTGAPQHMLALRSRAMSIASCRDPRYALQQVEPFNLDQGGGNPGTCIYRYQRDIPWMDSWPSQRDSVEMNVCPDSDYRITPNGRCTMNVISQQNGYEAKICQDQAGYNYDCSETPAPIIAEGVTYRIDQDPPIGQTKVGSRVTCTLVQFGSQPFGASWRGEVQWSGRCVLDRPQRIPATRRPNGSP